MTMLNVANSPIPLVEVGTTLLYVPASRPVFVVVLEAVVAAPVIFTDGAVSYPSPASEIVIEVISPDPAKSIVAVAVACMGLSPVGASIISVTGEVYPEPALVIAMVLIYSNYDGIRLVILYP